MVAIVADNEENADASDVRLPVYAVVLDRGYRPIRGGSRPEMPKLNAQSESNPA